MKRLSLALTTGIILVMVVFIGGCSGTLSTKQLSTPKSEAGSTSSASSHAQTATATASTSSADEEKTASTSATSKKITTSSASSKSEKSSADSTHKSSSKKPSRTHEGTASTSGSESKTPTVQKPSSSTSSKITVTVSVDCKTAVEKGYKEALALTSTGNLASKTVTLAKDASVYDALKASGLSIGAESTNMGTYVYAISSLREKACGSKSGWLYSVNGTFISDSCDSAHLKNGDTVRWRYTCDSGKDL